MNENIRTAAKPLDRVEQKQVLEKLRLGKSAGTGQRPKRELVWHCERFKERYAEVERRTAKEWGIT